MNQERLWESIGANEQRAALDEGLIAAGGVFTLLGDQVTALSDLERFYAGGGQQAVLVAPTGAGKTLVALRLAVSQYLYRQLPVVLLTPTRDLARQHAAYFAPRLAGTPLRLATVHGGVAPRERQGIFDAMRSGMVSILIASGMVLHQEETRRLLREAGFLIVDDVHAMDPVAHLKPLKDIATPSLYASATPEAVQGFLDGKGALAHVARMSERPFEAPPTQVIKVRSRPGTDAAQQVLQVRGAIDRHLAEAGRVYVVVRTRDAVPRLMRFMANRFAAPVFKLHGAMVDTEEQAGRTRVRHFRPEDTRVSNLQRFRETLPAILVATNLIGSGLDVPMADLMVVTDADGFGESELTQLIGRVGRRERASEAFIVTGTKPRGKGRTGKRGR